MNLKEVIIKGLNSGHRLIPTNKNKQPIVSGWKGGVDIKEVEKLSSVHGIAIATGEKLELIDFDLKYDLSGDLYDRYCEEVKMYSEDLFEKMSIQTTVNEGFHWFYKCDEISDGNLKLARREATESEKERGDKVKVLIETRGVGGYVIIAPTEGYKFIQGDLKNVNTISKIDRDFLMSLARSYNTYRDNKKEFVTENVTLKTAFDDYDDKVTAEETIGLLKHHGWTEVLRSGNRVSMLRSGETKAKHSGYYELDKSRFSVFSTSTEFEPETRYKNSAVFCVLEHGGNWTSGAKALYELGYGVTAKVKVDSDGQEITDEELKKYLVDYKSIWGLNEDWYDGKLEVGMPTGMREVDKFFVYRKKALYTITAMNNVGKTTIVQYWQIYGSVKHGMKWLIFAAENSSEDYADTLLGFYLQENPKQVRINDVNRYNDGKNFIEKHFLFLNNCKSVDTALKLSKAFYMLDNDINLFIDPINSVQPTDNIETWDYPSAITASRNIINFRKQYCAVWISMHPTISKQREVGMPRTVDSELGVFANKADVSIVLHREKEEIDNNLTEMKIDKVRSKKFGCNITPKDHYIQMLWKQYWFDFSAPRFEANGTVTRIAYPNPLKNNYENIPVKDDMDIKDVVKEVLKPATLAEAFPSEPEGKVDDIDSWLNGDDDAPF